MRFLPLSTGPGWKTRRKCKKILKHLGLWEKKARPPSKARAAPVRTDTLIDDSFSQLPMPARRLCGGSNKWLHVGPEYPEACPPLAWFTRLRRDLSGVPPCMIFQMGMPVQGRRITFFQTTDVLFAKILPQPCLPTDRGPLPINPISRKNEGLPHHASTLSLTHKAKSPMLRLHKRNFLSLISP
jgi:hypothetical protein